MAVNGQATDRGMSGMTSRDKGNYKPVKTDFVEGSSRKADNPAIRQAMNGHAKSRNYHPGGGIADAYGRGRSAGTARNNAGNKGNAHGPNVQFQGTDIPHDDVKTAPGKALGKTLRQARNSYGPNIQFHGADHRHDGVKTSGS